ncbi:MAG: TRAP transporter small permease [Clostridium sp.]|uniref:TRAP transporter small permease n=1 Tax=Clostridium sp. TaxID=1506 RepID=UPI003D6CB6AD
MANFKLKLTKILEIICISLFAIITIIGLYQIITRYVFNSPSTISEELLTFLFTWMALLSAALVFGKREHMRMSYVANFFKGKNSIYLSIFSEVVVLLFAVLILIYGGISITKLTTIQITASLGVSMALVYVVVPISGVLTVIYNILNINELMIELKKENIN